MAAVGGGRSDGGGGDGGAAAVAPVGVRLRCWTIHTIRDQSTPISRCHSWLEVEVGAQQALFLWFPSGFSRIVWLCFLMVGFLNGWNLLYSHMYLIYMYVILVDD